MGKRTTKAAKKTSATEYDGTTPLSPDEERACTALARILVQVQAEMRSGNNAQPPTNAGASDA